jgi:transcriptional regulator with XRE-family HTH domain
MSDDYGAWLGWAVKEAGISQRKLAAIMGVTPATICRWISGQRRPKHASRVMLAQVLKR